MDNTRWYRECRFGQCAQHIDALLVVQVTLVHGVHGLVQLRFSGQREPESSPFMKKVGDLLQHFLTKFWIWIVAIMLFVISFVGEKMTVLRIIYMALFLFFILTFQVINMFLSFTASC
ncbi:hypothetical protein PR048_022899 [Dryococelus australis]|uniref:Piezo TM1-24 domain-containing protein n=1 Tax=Dryococelus australis TaxID=614101 RepID=A0ABQ9GSN7_9NEOP|nr:hypothetical protein PR048_022899 [Dryococelus australis]